MQTEKTLRAPTACSRIQPSTASSSISASCPKPPGTCSTSNCGASDSAASGVSPAVGSEGSRTVRGGSARNPYNGAL